MPEALLVVAGYGLGTLPTALLVGRRTGVDPTIAGSGNPGASNVYRTSGKTAGALVLLGDLAKGALAAGAGLAVDGGVLRDCSHGGTPFVWMLRAGTVLPASVVCQTSVQSV